MTLAEKINLVELMDNTIITETESGYTIETIDGEEEVFSSKAELEFWLNNQLSADPAFYGLSVWEYCFISGRSVVVYDDLGNDITAYATGQYDLADCFAIAHRRIIAAEDCGKYTAVYISL